MDLHLLFTNSIMFTKSLLESSSYHFIVSPEFHKDYRKLSTPSLFKADFYRFFLSSFDHVSFDQLAPILQSNSDVILTVQAGFIGLWGEWYYTTHYGMPPLSAQVSPPNAVSLRFNDQITAKTKFSRECITWAGKPKNAPIWRSLKVSRAERSESLGKAAMTREKWHFWIPWRSGPGRVVGHTWSNVGFAMFFHTFFDLLWERANVWPTGGQMMWCLGGRAALVLVPHLQSQVLKISLEADLNFFLFSEHRWSGGGIRCSASSRWR